MRQRNSKKLTINLGLIASGLLTIFSGLLIQIQFHIGKNLNSSVLSFNYSKWVSVHKISIILLSVLMIYHISLHWKWYKTIVTKKLLKKNVQVMTLTFIFLLTAITGFIPWIIYLLKGSEIIRKAFIETHDKLAIILSIYFILHIIKRLKWFTKAFERMRN